MQIVKINGYDYYYKDGHLYEDEKCTLEVDKKFLTPNELQQVNTWLEYNGKPMISR